MKKPYKNIIFDLDGTLIDSRTAFDDSLYVTLKEFGLPIDDRMSKCFGLTAEAILNLYDFPQGMRYAFLDKWNCNTADTGSLLYEGIKDALLKLKGCGYILSILSSRTSESIRYALEKEGLLDCFDIIFGAEKTIGHKPSPEPIAELLKSHALKKSEVIYIGDMPTDSFCAQLSGVAFASAGWNKDAVGAPIRFATPTDMTTYFCG